MGRPWLVLRKRRRGSPRYSVCWRDAAGVHRSFPTRTGDRRVAEMHRARIEGAGAAAPTKGEKPDASKMLDSYLAHVALTLTPATSKAYGDYLRPMVRAWERVPVEEWGAELTKEYLARKRESGAWTVRSAQIWLSGCRGWIAYAKEKGLPLPDFVGALRAGRHQRRVPKFLEVRQVLELLKTARGHPLEKPIAIAAFAGMRRKEMRSAGSADVDWTKRLITVRGTKGHSDRYVPLPPQLAEVLRRLWPKSGPLVDFGTAHVETTYRQLAALCKAAGVPVVTWHALRHSYATALLDSGAELHEVQAALGHKSLASTGIYLHARLKSIQRAAKRAFG